MKRHRTRVVRLVVLSVGMFGLGGYVGTAAERDRPTHLSHSSSHTSDNSSTATTDNQAGHNYTPVPTPETVVNTVTKTVTVNKLSYDCQRLLDATQELYQAQFEFNGYRGDFLGLVDQAAQAMITGDKRDLNSVQEGIRQMHLKVLDSMARTARAERSVQTWTPGCQD